MSVARSGRWFGFSIGEKTQLSRKFLAGRSPDISVHTRRTPQTTRPFPLIAQTRWAAKSWRTLQMIGAGAAHLVVTTTPTSTVMGLSTCMIWRSLSGTGSRVVSRLVDFGIFDLQWRRLWVIFAHSLFLFAPLEMLLKQFGLVRNLTGAKKCRVGDLRRSAVANWVSKAVSPSSAATCRRIRYLDNKEVLLAVRTEGIVEHSSVS